MDAPPERSFVLIVKRYRRGYSTVFHEKKRICLILLVNAGLFILTFIFDERPALNAEAMTAAALVIRMMAMRSVALRLIAEPLSSAG